MTGKEREPNIDGIVIEGKKRDFFLFFLFVQGVKEEKGACVVTNLRVA